MLRDFAGRWKASIEAMHREVLGQVAEPGCGREVLQVGLVQECWLAAPGVLVAERPSLEL